MLEFSHEIGAIRWNGGLHGSTEGEEEHSANR